MKRTKHFARWIALIALGAVSPSSAQPGGTSTIEGRVYNTRSGEYAERARITVEGTSLETFTDMGGRYRIGPVPAGTVTVKAFFTGVDLQSETVTVPPGATVQRDFELGSNVVKLEDYVVSTSREMDATALALNEQRFAPDIRNVVSTEEFGNVAGSNSGEFLKFLPGVSIDYSGGIASTISLNGVPSDFVPVMIDGFSAASAGGFGNHSVATEFLSINNLSRVEVSFSPTPESLGSALAGSVNMVPRSSFERVRPIFNASVYLVMRDNARDFKKVPGPMPTPTRNVHPGFDFSYVAPVNQRFGFTLSGGSTTTYTAQDFTQMTWRGANTATNGTAFPHTTPDQPYLSGYLVQDAPKVTTRHSVGATIDYKLTENDRVTFGFQYMWMSGRFLSTNLNFNTVRVPAGGFTTMSTQGAVGAGTLSSTHQERDRINRSYTPTLIWRHDGQVWKSVLGLGLSQSSDYNRDMETGHFRNVSVQRSGVTISFDDLSYLRPGIINVTDGATGIPINPFVLSTYSLTSGTRAASRSYDRQGTAYGNVRRDFYTRIPFTLKAGFDVRESIRDFRGGTNTYIYVGPDGRASTTPVGNDDSPVPFIDPFYSQRGMPHGFPNLQTVSNRKVYEHYVANPSQFTENQNTSYRNGVTNSKLAKQLISAVYLRGDMSLLERRLKLVGGVRAEQTNVSGAGPLTDLTRNFQRNASGQVIRNASGAPLLIVPTSNALGVSQLTFIERGQKTDKEYLRLFPSLNASYLIRENLIARAAYSQSVGRPNMNQYAGGITLPDTDLPPANNNQIVVNNAAIKAWQAQTVNVRLERYFEGVGQISVGAFRRDFENFFGNTVFNATPEFLALYGLEPLLYGAFDVRTQHNIPGTVRTQGIDVSYKQALTFLPSWARGIQVFANGSSQRLLGDETASFAGFVPRTASWGVSLTRPKFNARVNWNYRGRQRNSPVTGTGIEPGTFNYTPDRLNTDVLGEYYFWKRLALFVSVRNIGSAVHVTEILGPSTPKHAHFRQQNDYGQLWTVGVKGTW